MSPRSALYRLSIVLPALLPFGCGEPDPEVALDPARPPIVLITLDTTRSDRLGCYGYSLPTSPQLDRLCEDATRYDAAYSTTSWTLPAHASLFTGEYTYSHGVRYDTDGPLVLSDAIDHRSAARYRARGLDADKPTLARRLSDAGYATAGFVGGPWMKRVFGLESGFDHWDDAGIDEENGRRAAALTDAAPGCVATQQLRSYCSSTTTMRTAPTRRPMAGGIASPTSSGIVVRCQGPVSR